MTVKKSLSTSLIFESGDERARVEIGTQVDFSYVLDSGGRAVVSLPLTALGTLDEVMTALMLDSDVQALVAAATPEPEPEPEEPTDPEPEVEP